MPKIYDDKLTKKPKTEKSLGFQNQIDMLRLNILNWLSVVG